MVALEDLRINDTVDGIIPNEIVEVVSIQWHGSDCLELTCKTIEGKVANQLLYREDQLTLNVVKHGQSWSFNSDGTLFKLVSEAKRIRLAYLFDPILAIHTSLVEPLPHQITAVYEHMLPRQPLRFLLADDPGSGKTIMAGLLIKELIIRGDVQRCLIVCPGSLVDQWQFELYSRFGLNFEILTKDKLDESYAENWFDRHPLVIARLDKLSRDQNAQQKLERANEIWDLIVCDEAHKMSATLSGDDIKYTKRYRLGQLLSHLTRHFLLMSATPHNGKEADFQLFMALLDPDRFEGKFRGKIHRADVSDLMRRMVKEGLRRFDGTPLFPERIASTVPYSLSSRESILYQAVTKYVQDEFDRASVLENKKRAGTVGFALMTLQRRLASSPQAIYQSLQRRLKKLENRLKDFESGQHIEKISKLLDEEQFLDNDEIDDLEDIPDSEMVDIEDKIFDRATAAQSVYELQMEIKTLKSLENKALEVCQSNMDKKWTELSDLLNKMFMSNNANHGDPLFKNKKLVVFTEYQDTLYYLKNKIEIFFGKQDAVVIIHGGISHQERLKAQESFRFNPDIQVLIATDAAGEGINLQQANLMVNYDLPWNPNRLQQRFGRIHRIGQTQVCYLWNLVAKDTREGDVYLTLLAKLEQARKSLGGQVFDVVGQLFFGPDNKPVSLRDLMINAIRYGEKPSTKKNIQDHIDQALDVSHIKKLLEDHKLASDTMDISPIKQVKESVERASAYRLQPYYVESFFLKAFEVLGGTLRKTSEGPFEVTHVPSLIKRQNCTINIGQPMLPFYKNIVFDKKYITDDNKEATFIFPGHPLLDAVLDLTLEQYHHLLKCGTILIDESDTSKMPRMVYYLEHTIENGVFDKFKNRQAVSKRMIYIETDHQQSIQHFHYAPYLDYKPLSEYKIMPEAVLSRKECQWLSKDLESKIINYAISDVVPKHLSEVKEQKLAHFKKIKIAVNDRLMKQISYWDHRAEVLKSQEQANKFNAKLNSKEAKKRADALDERLKKRLQQLEREAQLIPMPPLIVGGFLVAPKGLIDLLCDDLPHSAFSKKINTIECGQRALNIVMDVERKLGFFPVDREKEKLGYDIESRSLGTGELRFIEVKGRITGAPTITLTRNEILCSLNNPSNFILAIVEFLDDNKHKVHYIRQPASCKPDFGVTSVNYGFAELLAKSHDPASI